MKNTIIKVVIFTVGAAVGSAATWKYFKTKYERIAQEEIESIKEVYSQKNQDDTAEDVSEYNDILDNEGYTKSNEKKEDENMDKPYVISPEEFGEIEDYETYSLTYYADGVLTDEGDEPIEDIESMVGEDSLNHFGEYEDDSVFVRNDRTMTDYEILRDIRCYSDIRR